MYIYYFLVHRLVFIHALILPSLAMHLVLPSLSVSSSCIHASALPCPCFEYYSGDYSNWDFIVPSDLVFLLPSCN